MRLLDSQAASWSCGEHECSAGLIVERVGHSDTLHLTLRTGAGGDAGAELSIALEPKRKLIAHSSRGMRAAVLYADSNSSCRHAHVAARRRVLCLCSTREAQSTEHRTGRRARVEGRVCSSAVCGACASCARTTRRALFRSDALWARGAREASRTRTPHSSTPSLLHVLYVCFASTCTCAACVRRIALPRSSASPLCTRL